MEYIPSHYRVHTISNPDFSVVIDNSIVHFACSHLMLSSIASCDINFYSFLFNILYVSFPRKKEKKMHVLWKLWVQKLSEVAFESAELYVI
jgi:hypothetical protein